MTAAGTDAHDLDPDELATALAVPIGDVGGRFMLSGRTYATGAEHGFTGLDFYFCGRAGVLGPVDADVVVHELGFFEPGNVRILWEAGRDVMAPQDAAALFLRCGYDWGRARLPQDLPAGRLAELARAVTDGTGQEQPALFRAWNAVAWPDDDVDRALHGIHLLRELRGGHHVRAAHANDLDPHGAVLLQTGVANAELFGWSAPHPDPEPCRAAWDRVELATNADMVAALSVLDADERAELLALARRAVPG
ncbi:MAG: SCO6745 family protein [Microthrixaceae bacterium]